MPVNLEEWKKIYNRLMKRNDFVEGENVVKIEDVKQITIKGKPFLQFVTDKGNFNLNLDLPDRFKAIANKFKGKLENPNALIGKTIKIHFKPYKDRLYPDFFTLEFVETQEINSLQNVTPF